MSSPLPDNWIDALFARLTGIYGNRFTNMWANIDAKLIRQTWAKELAGVTPSGIKHALDHLPDEFPPTVLQFRRICIARPEQATNLAIDVSASEAVRKAVISGMKVPEANGGMKAWAHRLKSRHDGGDKLGANQIRCYRIALGLDKQEHPA